jgi:hypothetical protein
MQHNSKANSPRLSEKLAVLPASQEIPRPSWNPKFQHRVYKGPTAVSIVSQMLPPPPGHSFINIYFNTLPSTPKSCKWALAFRISNRNIVRIPHLRKTVYMPRPSHHPEFAIANKIWWRVQIVEVHTFWRFKHLYETTSKILVLYILIFNRYVFRQQEGSERFSFSATYLSSSEA